MKILTAIAYYLVYCAVLPFVMWTGLCYLGTMFVPQEANILLGLVAMMIVAPVEVFFLKRGPI